MLPTLKGNFSKLDFDGTTCSLTFSTNWAAGSLGRALGSRTVPVAALAAAVFEPTRGMRVARLRLVLRDGADPLADAAAGRLSDEDDPYVVVGVNDDDLGRRYAAELTGRIDAAGFAGVAATSYLLPEPVAPPLEAKGGEGRIEFDGDTIAFVWGYAAPEARRWQKRRTLPLAAIEGIEFVNPGTMRGGWLRFRVTGAEPVAKPSRDPDAFQVEPGAAGRPLLVAAAVLAALQRSRSDAGARPVTPRRIDGAPIGPRPPVFLAGLHGHAGFDGAVVTVAARGATRRIPLAAVDWVELVDSGPGRPGWVRVHLAGAPPDPGTFDPQRDQDTVCHRDDQAALDFAHRVTGALDGLERVPDAGLLATRGERPDIAAALGRAGLPARGLVKELRALPDRLPDGDRVEELELAVLDGQPGLLVRSGRRMLLLQGGRPALSLSCRGLRVDWSAPGDDGLGELTLETGTASHRLTGVWAPARLAAGLRPDDTPAVPDPVGTLRRLDELKAAGLLSDDEYRTRRTALLDRL
jgi:hypothetical protein